MVVGAGNSGEYERRVSHVDTDMYTAAHDICEDLYKHGASVTMYVSEFLDTTPLHKLPGINDHRLLSSLAKRLLLCSEVCESDNTLWVIPINIGRCLL